MANELTGYNAGIMRANTIDEAIPYSWSPVSDVYSRAKEYVHELAQARFARVRQSHIEERTEEKFQEFYNANLGERNREQRRLIPKYHVQLLMQGEDLTLDQAGLRFVKDGLAKCFADCYKDRVVTRLRNELSSQEPLTLQERMLGYIAQKTS